MISRCTNPKAKRYSRYGARGIRVCDRWLTFKNFWFDMGAMWAAGLTLERIDNDGNYELENCRWATRQEQSRNTSRSHLIVYAGETHLLCDWAKITGIRQNKILNRLRYGWSFGQALGRESRPQREKIVYNRHNVLITYEGKTRCITEWARELKMSPATLHTRIMRYGWSHEKALSQKLQPHRRKAA